MRTRIVIGSLLALALAGCAGEEYSDLKSWVKEHGEGLRGKVERLPEVKPYEPFAYNAFDLPDPFKPRKIVAAKAASGGFQPDLNRRKEPLESYPLENLKMVGTLEQKNAFYALIKSPDNNLYRVKVGEHMGQNFGQITEINEAQVKLKEIVEDTGGEWSERASTIQLQEEK